MGCDIGGGVKGKKEERWVLIGEGWNGEEELRGCLSVEVSSISLDLAI